MQMSRVGTIIRIERVPMPFMTTGGSMSGLTKIIVKFDDDIEETFSPEDLMRADI
jgi:hypothetical protein